MPDGDAVLGGKTSKLSLLHIAAPFGHLPRWPGIAGRAGSPMWWWWSSAGCASSLVAINPGTINARAAFSDATWLQRKRK